MVSIASRRNHSPFKTRNSYEASRTVDNSGLRQSASLASDISLSTAAFSSQRTAYSKKQSLSRSYDSPEGLRRKSQQVPFRKASSSFYRAASPHSYASSSKQHNSASGRNQTVLDDAAWMSERLLNLQKTGFLRYSLISKLRDTVGKQPDEPLAAFRLAEVTLSEEDLLTDISLSEEFSTSMPTPLLVQSYKNRDQVSPRSHQGSRLSQEIGKDYQIYMQQKDVNEKSNSNANHLHSLAAPKSTSSMVRGDLLLRLEALQHRAELAAKGGTDLVYSNVNANQHIADQYWNASSQQSYTASSTSPTHSTLSIEPIYWPQEPGNSSDSTCWLKDNKQEAITEPSASLLNPSSSKNIRPEYYLPLSKEEPVLESGSSSFLSHKGAKRTELKHSNIRRRALNVCQQKSEGGPEKSLNNHKQRPRVRKNKRVLQSSTDSGVIPVNSAPKPLPGVTMRTLPLEARTPQNYLSGEYKDIAMVEQHKGINKPSKVEAFASEMNGSTRSSKENKFDYDGDSSWISEENVEGFLCSQSLALVEREALSTSNGWPSLYLDTDLMHQTAESLSSTAERFYKNKNTKESRLRDSGKHLFSSSPTACLHDKVIDDSNDSMGSICTFDCCKEVHMSSQGGSNITGQKDAPLQLLKEGSLAHSCQEVKASYQSECQDSYLGEESLKNNLIACYKSTLSNEQLSKESHHDPGVEEQISGQEDLSRWNAVSSEDLSLQKTVFPKDLITAIKKSINNLTVETEMKLEGISTGHCYSSRSSFHGSVPLVSEKHVSLASDALSSPAELLGEDRHWPAIAKKNDSTKGQKDLTRIMRSLSFTEGGDCEPKLSSKLQKSKDISESESTGFAHIMTDEEAYSLKMQQTKEPLQRTPSENGKGDKDKLCNGNVARLILLDNSCITDLNSEQCAGEPSVIAHTLPLSEKEFAASLNGSCEVQLSNKDFTQLSLNVQLDNPTEMHYKFAIEKVQEDIRSCEVKNRALKCGRSEINAKGCYQQSVENLTVQESFCTKKLQNEPEEIEPKIVFEKLTLSEEQVCIASSANQNNGEVVEGANNREVAPKYSTPSYIGNWRETDTGCGGGKTPCSLSIYKNPLWRDEFEADCERGHGSQNECLDHLYSDEGNFLDPDQNRVGFSKRSLGAVWDTYEGMGEFINSFPNSPSCTAKHISEGNQIPVHSTWDLESSSKQLEKFGEEAGKLCGSFELPRLNCHRQVEQCQQSSQSLETTESETINHDTLSSGPKAIFWFKRNSISERDSIFDGARISDDVDCLREHNARSLVKFHSANLINNDVNHQNGGNASTTNDLFLTSGPKCTPWKKMVPVTEMSCETDDVRGGRGFSDQLDCIGTKIERESKVQTRGASTNIETISAFQCADRTLQTDPHCGHHNKGCSQPVHQKPGSAKPDAPEENHSVNDLGMNSNDGTKASEEVKQVTFIFSDSKEPQKNLQAGGTMVPQIPLNLLSTWILSFFTHASKSGVNIKRRDQTKPLIQGKAHEDQAELKRIGEKVQALEAKINRFKQENRKLQSLVKCMIRKMKGLQQNLRERKRNRSSRGFMTCIYSIRVQRS